MKDELTLVNSFPMNCSNCDELIWALPHTCCAFRMPARAFPLWSYIHEEMVERGWDKRELATRMGGDAREVAISELSLGFMESVRDPALVVGDVTANKLATAFGVSPEYFLNLDAAFRQWLSARKVKA